MGNSMFSTSHVSGFSTSTARPPAHRGGGGEASSWEAACRSLIPCVFNVLQTVLGNLALVYLPPCLWQMFRGSCLIFVALLASTCLRQKHYAFHWAGISFCFLGLVTIGIAGLLKSGVGGATDGGAGMLFGIIILIIAQFLRACRFITEEFLLKTANIPASSVVAWEGVWGTMAILAIVYPLLYIVPGSENGHTEDVVNTFVMFSGSRTLICLVALSTMLSAVYIVCGLLTAEYLTSVHRSLAAETSAAVMWAVSLVVYYLWDAKSAIAEAWSPYSVLQGVGFATLIFGQLVYGEVVILPGFEYQALAGEHVLDETQLVETVATRACPISEDTAT